MERPRAPFRELTDPDNVNVLGTLNNALWSAAQRAEARALFFEIAPAVGQEWIERGLMRTGAVNGDMRRDLVEAMQGARQPTVALGLAPQPNGHTGQPQGDVKVKVPRL